MKKATPQDVLAIAYGAKISARTVERYFSGKRVHLANQAAIETACRKRRLMNIGQLAAHEQDPRTFGEG